MASISFTKDPDDVLDYALDWTARLMAGDTIVTSQWMLPEATPGGINKDSDSTSDTTTLVWLSGGVDGKSYSLVNRVVTAGGRTMDQTCIMKIKTR